MSTKPTGQEKSINDLTQRREVERPIGQTPLKVNEPIEEEVVGGTVESSHVNGGKEDRKPEVPYVKAVERTLLSATPHTNSKSPSETIKKEASKVVS